MVILTIGILLGWILAKISKRPCSCNHDAKLIIKQDKPELK